jgi:hypothetical protein
VTGKKEQPGQEYPGKKEEMKEPANGHPFCS